MTFRLKVFLAIAATVIVLSLAEAGLDLVATRSVAWLEARTERHLERYADSLAGAIDLRGVVPIRAASESIDLPRGRRAAYRIVREEVVVHGEREAFPVAGPGWVTAERELVAGYRLEAALGRTGLERFVAHDLLVDLVDLPLFLALAFGLSWLLARNLMRPIRELTVASEQLAAQGRPRPIAVPSGDDELSRMARSFNAMSESIQGYLERERVFTRYASHELRTPLSALRTQVERAQLGLAPAEEVLPVLARNVGRMEGILGALLALARSSERDPAPMPLRSLVREAVRALPPREAARVTLEDRTAVAVEVTDARLVQQALQNLVDNALRHTAGPVRVRVDAREAWVELRVRDRGAGLPEELLRGPRKPFARHGHDRGGLGLGLSLVDSIAQALRGELRLRNLPVGLEARLRLPVRADAGAPPAPEREPDGRGGPAPVRADAPASLAPVAAAPDARRR